MRNILSATLLLAALVLSLTGCVSSKIAISAVVPGELNLQDVSKIAVLDFQTLESNSAAGVYAVNAETRLLAKRLVESAFYKHPFYSIVDFDLEALTAKSNPNGRPKQRFDAIIYGRLWWQSTPEHRGLEPQMTTLKTWHIEKYIAHYGGRRGVPVAVSLLDQTQDTLLCCPYRGRSGTLIMDLSVFRVAPNGELSKLTEIFEVASERYVFRNPRLDMTMESLDLSGRADRLSALRANAGGSPKGPDDNAPAYSALPAEKMTQRRLIEAVVTRLAKKIAPRDVVIEINVRPSDKKVAKMLEEGAYMAAGDYIIACLLAKGDRDVAAFFRELDFERAARLALKEGANGEMSEATAKRVAAFLADNAEPLYFYGLAEEAQGHSARALAIYREVFKRSASPIVADGISRCLFAMDMADKLDEEFLAKWKAERKNEF